MVDTTPENDARIAVTATARLSGLALVVGVLGGAAAYAFVLVLHLLIHWLWHGVPALMGFDQAPWWMVVTMPVLGALLTYAAFKLPGHGGHSPLGGFGLDIGPRQVTSVLAASGASLAFGAVLGPEAPLMAVGTTMGALAFRGKQPAARQVMMIVGAMAATGALFGNPLITSILMLEVALTAGAAMATPTVLVPSLVGLGTSYLFQVGVGSWSGIGPIQMSLPALAAYPTVRLLDLVVAVPLAVAVAVVTIAARLGAMRVDRLAQRSPLPTLVAAGLVTGLCGIAVMVLVPGGSSELVLFSGQTAMGAYLANTSLVVAAVVLGAKFVAYSVCLGSGFRGGALFPAVALGTILATMVSPMVGPGPSTALVAAAIGAGVASGMRFPFTAVLMGVLLTISAGPAATVPAIVGAAVGMLVRLAVETRVPSLAPPAQGASD